MSKSKSPAKNLRSLKRLITFRKKYRVQYLDFKPTKSNLSICYQTSVSIEPLKCNVQQGTVKQSQPFTKNEFLSLAEAFRQKDDQKRKKEREEREKERESDLRSLKSMLSLPPF